MSNTVRFEEDAVKEHLDECIQYWRDSDDPNADIYVDAYQSMRTSLFGVLLEAE